MPKILITGNGFDLNFGLPTHYSDFINVLEYISNQEVEIDFKNVYSLCRSKDKILKEFNEFEFDQIEIKSLINLSSNNRWYKYFRRELKIETWIDFENRIEKVLEIMSSLITEVEAHFESTGSKRTIAFKLDSNFFKKNKVTEEVLEIFEILKFHTHAITFKSTNYLKTRENMFTGINASYLYSDLYSELSQFKKLLCQYFDIFVFPLYENSKKNIDVTIYSKIDEHYTFNYTPTFEYIFNPSIQTNYLHGKVEKTSNKIVLGVNGIPKNKHYQKELHRFAKYYQRLSNETDYQFLQKYKNMLSSELSIFFFGHSLDSSDSNFINEVFDLIGQNTRSKSKIAVLYLDHSSYESLLLNLINIRGWEDIDEKMREGKLHFKQIESDQAKELLMAKKSHGTDDIIFSRGSTKYADI